MTDTPELIAMARAMYCADEEIDPAKNEAFLRHWFTPQYGEGDWDWSIYETYTRMARAALLAIRDLSPEAHDAGHEICGRDYVGKGLHSDMTDPEEVWTAIINHITGETGA